MSDVTSARSIALSISERDFTTKVIDRARARGGCASTQGRHE